MSKKIEWIKRGMTANNGLHMQEICNQIANETSPENLTSVIKGSDTVVVDVAEDKQTVEVHLDNNITTEIHNSLQKPTQAPASTQLVAIGTNKAQTMLNIGDGLSVENGSLKASGGTGTKKYMHYLHCNFLPPNIGTMYVNIQIISSKPDKFTNETLFDFLQNEYSTDARDNGNLMYSPVELPNNVITLKIAFFKNNDISMSEIGIWWYENGNSEIQTLYCKKGESSFFIRTEHIIEL